MTPNLLDRFSESDLFNYYLGGLVWTLVLTGFFPLTMYKVWSWFSGNVIILSMSLIILPYLLGVVLGPLSEMVAAIGRPNFIQQAFADPGRGKALTQSLRDEAVQAAEQIFGVSVRESSNYFAWMQAYIWQYGGGSVNLACRAKAMRNLIESLLLPAPLLSGIIVYRLALLADGKGSYGLVLGVLSAGVLFCSLRWKYHRLYDYYVKHTIRAFLVIAKTTPQQERNCTR